MADLETYLGFALRKKCVVKGFNAVATLRRAHLLVVCASASANAQKQALSLKRKFGCPLLSSKKPVSELVAKENCKLIAITDSSLAKAMRENADENLYAIVREDV